MPGLANPLTSVYAAQLPCDTSIQIHFGAHLAALNFSAAAPSLWNLKRYDSEPQVLWSTSPLILYVMFNMVQRPLSKISPSDVFSFPGGKKSKTREGASGIRKTFDFFQQNTGRSRGLSLKRSVSHSAALSRKTSQSGQDTVRCFNFLQWIKALHTCQAIASSIWSHLSPSADLCS